MKKFHLGEYYYCFNYYDSADCVLEMRKTVDDSLVDANKVKLDHYATISLGKQLLEYKNESNANGVDISKEVLAYKNYLMAELKDALANK